MIKINMIYTPVDTKTILMLLWAAGFLLLLIIPNSYSASLEGNVTRIADGDTITIRDANNQKQKIRLMGIDTPELDQPFGLEARDFLVGLIFSQFIIADCPKKDRYKRWICKVWFVDIEVNKLLVREGWAWWYRAYQQEQLPDDRRAYEKAEVLAKQDRVGVWADDSSIPPWEWRRQKRERQKSK
ncbi:thermonuclease family protein [Burkholderiales bacterium]|nr:thermonuclease family protein [Burkholderiales bacterium]